MLKETEEELVRAAQAGNIAAFERLVRLLEGQMLAVAAGFAHTPDDANDIYQDAMLAAFRALPKFKLESKFSTWLHKIVVNTALSNRRKLKRAWQKLAHIQNEYEQEETYIERRSPESSVTNFCYFLRKQWLPSRGDAGPGDPFDLLFSRTIDPT